MMTIACEFTQRLLGNNRRLIPTKTGRWCSDPRYRQAKEELSTHFGKEFTARNIGACEVLLFYTRKQWRGDIDNCIKVVLDALAMAGVIQNDKLVQKLEIERIEGITSHVVVKGVER